MEREGYALVGRAINQHPAEKPYSTSIEEVPVTFERKPYVPSIDDPLMDAGTARATIAASRESPNGTQEGDWARTNQHRTVVQQHVAYWDRDNDGIIWPLDTYRGVRAWGWSIPLAFLAMFIINFNLSYPTVPGWLPDPFFRIWVSRLHKDKHGSDSMSFDNEGRFKPQNFEDLFAKYDRGNKGGLDAWDLLRAWKGQRMVFDFFGWSAAFLEWFATYLLLWPEDGILRKEDVRRVFDGSIFQHKADEYAAKQRKMKASGRKQGWAMNIRAKVV
ncbi:Caleosin-domain-containing protein [Saccharata proteae CBS 121410]|uniref:Caleosin-domain-containing protein n=1 Tax=Saccharata proteae CBS 121410 TaxID=1314787 RepID=A0A6A5YBB0_9PEZI|nr:Caleosin-domain-containing protein [Saccharata proteae CBS 121410]